MNLKKLILESTNEETVMKFLSDIIKGTEYENKVFLAGGAVRDEIMGKSAKDLDFVVLGDLNSGINFSIWLSQKLGNYKEESNPVIYPRFGTSKLSLNGNQLNLPNIELEFVAPRKESYTAGSRKPEVSDGQLIDDVLRRDLTINSLLKNVSTGEVLDLTGKGIEDIKNGVIRTTSDSSIIFKDDPLRMLRAIRFAVKYDFEIDTDVIKSIRKHASLIDTISKERINDELNKILLSSNPSKGIRLLKITTLLTYIIEEFNDAVGMKQNIHHKDDVFKHSMDVLSKTPDDLKTRLIALFHDIGKVLTKSVTPEGSVHFYGHEKAGEEMVRKIMFRLKYPNDLIDAVASGVRNHMALKHGGDDATGLSDKSIRKFIDAVGDNLENILDVIHADNISHSETSSMPNQINIVRQRINTLNSNLDKSNLKLPIDGNDLIKMGLKPGKIFKDILNAVQEAWYENPNITREESIEIVNRFRTLSEIDEIKNLINLIK
jgi:putative nucleotidyltransferase with HDIG domain